MKKFLVLLVLVAVLALAFNDGGRWFSAQSTLNKSTDELVSWAAINLNGTPLVRARSALDTEARPMGVRIIRYTTTGTGIELWTEKTVTGTFVLGTYMAMKRGVPFDRAFRATFPVRSYAQMTYR